MKEHSLLSRRSVKSERSELGGGKGEGVAVPRRGDLFVHILRSTIFEEGLRGRFGSLRDCCSKSTERSSSVGDDGTCPPPVLHTKRAVKVGLAHFLHPWCIFRRKKMGHYSRKAKTYFPALLDDVALDGD